MKKTTLYSLSPLLVFPALLSIAVSCSHSTPESARVSIINDKVPSSCVMVGDVEAKNISQLSALEDLKTMTSKLGGGFVKITANDEGMFSSSIHGKAYNCN